MNQWNEQIKFHGLPFQKMEKIKIKVGRDESPAVLLNSSPADYKTSGSPIIRSLLALIKGSHKEIIIENAYMISSQSVDEPVVSNPILSSALRLKKLGAHVVLKNGSTLHSKVALFDGEISFVTSYNLQFTIRIDRR